MEAISRAAMTLPDLPPLNPGDPAPHELIIPFLDAVARKTEAFRELREKILPKWNPPKAPVRAIHQWLARWRLDSFADHGLNENIQSWVFQILAWWKRDPKAA